MDEQSRGHLFVLSAPSGVGKTTVTRQLQKEGLIQASVSCTTRQPRPSEVEGESYFFVSEKKFLRMREAGLFLEWAQVYGNYYGTKISWVKAKMNVGKNVWLEVDCQGALQIKEKCRKATLIFLSPPDLKTLQHRLENRGEDSCETIKRRLQAAHSEMEQSKHFRYVIINDNLSETIEAIKKILLKQE